MALDDADWHPASDEDQIATGVMIGSGIGGLEGIVEAGYTCATRVRAASRRSSSPAG
jgi:3-oxoacyl-(acyl-carrier-protein) synthase